MLIQIRLKKLLLKRLNNSFFNAFLIFGILLLVSCHGEKKAILELESGANIAMIGGNLGSRAMAYGHIETAIYDRIDAVNVRIRNFCDAGDTPGFRAHPGRPTPWAFPGAELYHPELSQHSNPLGHFKTPDGWLEEYKTDIILAFFGNVSAFKGLEGLDLFEKELAHFTEHTLSKKYNGISPPKIVFVSPVQIEKKSSYNHKWAKYNENVKRYAQVISEIANKYDQLFIDLTLESENWYESSEALTIDGIQLTEMGYRTLANHLSYQLCGGVKRPSGKQYEDIRNLVIDKNWFWHNDYKIPNGVHVYGRRYKPFGPDNYPQELEKVKAMTANRDSAIWAFLKGEEYDLKEADSNTPSLATVETNFTGDDVRYLYDEEALASFTLAEDLEISCFASEKNFPDLANPVQMSFDDEGRLWVAVMPSYPHYRPGDAKPNDKLLILEDTDGDQVADKQTIFADKLSLPIGFEFVEGGVLLSQAPNLVYLQDTDGDDRSDKSTILLSGFDDHDTHHAISAFCADPSGSVYMGEGVFLHSNIESVHGTVRATNGGFFRYSFHNNKLERFAQLSIPNPWGIAFDEWGQPFFAETSGPDVLWMTPGSIYPFYGLSNPKGPNIIEEEHKVRPTSGLEFLHSSHFPDEWQGALMINNTIGFLGTKLHRLSKDDSLGYTSSHIVDLVKSTDPNFRPVDMEIAPDGSLFLVDWHNALIGHMQHNARDPLRDHAHGRIYRITHTDRPLQNKFNAKKANITELFEKLETADYRTRYRIRRTLRQRNVDDVMAGLKEWIEKPIFKQNEYPRLWLEVLWVLWGSQQTNSEWIQAVLTHSDPRIRAGGIQYLRYNHTLYSESVKWLKNMTSDEDANVLLELGVAATWLPQKDALAILDLIPENRLPIWGKSILIKGRSHITGQITPRKESKKIAKSSYDRGEEIYHRDGYCVTCHRPNGKGLEAAGYPPLVDSEWLSGSPAKVVKIVLHGLMGPIEVNGKKYEGKVPMTPYGNLLKDEEIADVINYVRQEFGDTKEEISAKDVLKIREETKEQKGFYTAKQLLDEK